MSKKYIITEDKLLEFLTDLNEFYALRNGGVDDWEWNGLSCKDYLNDSGYSDFEEIAENDIDNLLKNKVIEEYNE